MCPRTGGVAPTSPDRGMPAGVVSRVELVRMQRRDRGSGAVSPPIDGSDCGEPDACGRRCGEDRRRGYLPSSLCPISRRYIHGGMAKHSYRAEKVTDAHRFSLPTAIALCNRGVVRTSSATRMWSTARTDFHGVADVLLRLPGIGQPWPPSRRPGIALSHLLWPH